MLLLVTLVKLVAEIALMALLGQGLLALLVGERRHANLIYRLLQTVSSPFVKRVRVLVPKALLDRHLPVAAFVLLLGVWLIATVAKVSLCLQTGLAHCR